MSARLLLLAALWLLVGGCTTVDRVRTGTADLHAPWAVLPIANHTETPQAGLRCEAIVESVLRTLGVAQLERYPAELSPDALLEPGERKVAEQALAWARGRGVRYAVTGSVEEWRYKTGVDGEPAVGITLTVTDLQSGRVVYSASGGKTGWSREALSAVGQKLVKALLADLPPAR